METNSAAAPETVRAKIKGSRLDAINGGFYSIPSSIWDINSRVNRKIHFVYVTYLALYLLGFVIKPLSPLVRNFGMLAIAVLPAFFVWRKGLLNSRFWQALALAHTFWGLGQVLWIAIRVYGFPLSAVQDTAYWMFKLLILGAILYRPFYAGSELNRRLHLIDTSVALSIIGYYIGYFFILPSIVHLQVAGTFYSSVANVMLNTGIAATAAVVAWEARSSGWGKTYRLIATGLTLYTAASMSFLIFGMPYNDPFWCAAFWVMSLAVASAPARRVQPIDAVLIPSRYGFSLTLIAAITAFHLVSALLVTGQQDLQDVRRWLTLGEVVMLTALLHFRHRIVVEESEYRRTQLDVTLSSLRQPIYIVDGDYNVVLSNDVFRSRFNASTGPCYSVVFGRNIPCDWCELKAQRPFSAAVEIRDLNYQLEFAPITAGKDSKGGVELLVDITTERKRQQQLIQTERMAALGRMIAGTAHELNNPLAIVLGNAQLLRDYSGLTFEGRRQVAAIASAAERARDIVHTFLTLSRPGESDKTFVDLVDVIRSVEHLKATELATYNIATDLDLPSSLTMMGRYTLLQEIFLNLIDNARDAIRQAKRSRGLIVIHGRKIRDGRIRIEVSDNGVGILRENRDRIFDPFFSTKDVGQGTGLGLSIVHSIIVDHDGRIQVESDGETFTRFEIEFPLVPIAPYLSPPKLRTAAVLRILAVDDEPEILNILENSLGRMGHHVECTTTGSRALQLLSKNKFDVLLLDMHLPEMDGKSIVKRIQAMIPPVSVKTIVISGDTMSDEIRQFAEDYSLPLVMKPVDVEKLNQLLQDATAGN